MNIKITKLRDGAVIPSYATPGSAAFDLTVSETVTVMPHAQGVLPTGLVFHIPEDHVLLICTRSSTFGRHGLLPSNGVGVIDSDYCGPEDEVKILTFNPGDNPVTIEAGTRLAQGIIIPHPRITFVEGISDGPSRGGLGSTGT
ncbi:MAG: dUTP diphosphatase [bacterium]|nr:dUTP diphosphatase [bacterium]